VKAPDDGGRAGGPEGLLRVLTSPAMLVVIAAAFGHGAIQTIFRPLIAPYATDLGAGPLLASAVVAAVSLPGFLLAVPAGSVAQRFGERWILVAGGACMTAAGLLVALVHALGALAAAMLLAGVGVVSISLAAQGLATAPVMAGNLDTRRVAAFGTSVMVGQMAGPTIGGVMTDAGGYATAFWGVAVLGLGMTVLGFAAFSVGSAEGDQTPAGERTGPDDPEVPAADRAPDEGGSYRRAWGILGTPLVPTAVVLSSLGTLLITLRTSFLPLYLDQIGWSASAIGLLLSGAAVAGLVFRALFPVLERRMRPSTMFAACLVVSAAALAATVTTRSVPVIVVATATASALLGVLNPASLTLLSRLVTAHRRRLALGVRITARHITQLLGPLAFGAVAGLGGVRVAFFALATVTGLAGGFGTRRLAKRQ
jgi:MFS family permease